MGANFEIFGGFDFFLVAQPAGCAELIFFSGLLRIYKFGKIELVFQQILSLDNL